MQIGMDTLYSFIKWDSELTTCVSDLDGENAERLSDECLTNRMRKTAV